MAGKAQLIQLEQREIRHLANRDFAELRPPHTSRRALRRPAQRILVADTADAVTRPLQQKRRAYFLYQVRTVIRCRTIDAETDPDARILHLADRAAARGQYLV